MLQDVWWTAGLYREDGDAAALSVSRVWSLVVQENEREEKMFSVRQKREIADKVQKLLRETNHPELPVGEIDFVLHVDGDTDTSWAYIKNNGAVTEPGVNPWNEEQDSGGT